jgi:hypothetical protein
MIVTLLVAGSILIVAVVVGLLVLVKLGVIAQYALKPEDPVDKLGDYGLDESHETEGKATE